MGPFWLNDDTGWGGSDAVMGAASVDPYFFSVTDQDGAGILDEDVMADL